MRRRPVTLPPPELRWAEVPDRLLALAAGDLDAGDHPRPRLAAHRGDDALAIATLRPFEAGEILDAVIELLALFVPLGADRVCVAFPCRVWSPLDPIPPRVEDDGIDLRQPAVVVGTADGHDGACRTAAAVHPFVTHEHDEWGWQAPFAPDAAPHGPLLSAPAIVVDGRQGLGSDRSNLQSQLERVLLLGHVLALGPAAVRELPLPPLARLASVNGADG
jgi:hypothetical protein